LADEMRRRRDERLESGMNDRHDGPRDDAKW
jgi:hypothetical protein